MKHQTHSETLKLLPEDNRKLFYLCGKSDEHLKLIADYLHVIIKHRGYMFAISGESNAVKQACAALYKLYQATDGAHKLQAKEIQVYLHAITSNSKHEPVQPETAIHFGKNAVIARGETQLLYLENIQKYDINFGIGPAGTGKTYLAVAAAVQALEAHRVSRIILVRPIVEAGEKLGFLPGDIAQKVHPYLQPLYDALYEMLGFEKVANLIDKKIIELLPLAYMRGRSLNDSFIILDEAQNTTMEQMKMFLTRIGFNSKAVITGDITQIDLESHKPSGLIHTKDVLNNVPGICFTQFKSSDVIRHPLVQCIVEAYERYEKYQLSKQ